jgi:hypothetical protein
MWEIGLDPIGLECEKIAESYENCDEFRCSITKNQTENYQLIKKNFAPAS